jgi:hypothetical protein
LETKYIYLPVISAVIATPLSRSAIITTRSRRERVATRHSKRMNRRIKIARSIRSSTFDSWPGYSERYVAKGLT